MGFKRPSEGLLDLIKELKYARTGENKLAAMLFATSKARKEYKKLTYTEVEELMQRV